VAAVKLIIVKILRRNRLAHVHGRKEVCIGQKGERSEGEKRVGQKTFPRFRANQCDN